MSRIAGLGGAVFLAGCSASNKSPSPGKTTYPKAPEVTATEDLMREHGVLRRALFVYSESASKMQRDPLAVTPASLNKTAALFRSFGEDYHEKKLEEAFIFPALKIARPDLAPLADVLIAQHNRGREITDFILAVTKGTNIDDRNIRPLTRAMRSFVRMYRPHAAREDTVVFPAWKLTLTAQQLDELNDKFEDIEHDMLGDNGFENAVRQISEIESEIGLADLARFTAPPPPVSSP
jgi:hemerythrin-like domain-containing protein